jgi:hypothetical protein
MGDSDSAAADSTGSQVGKSLSRKFEKSGALGSALSLYRRLENAASRAHSLPDFADPIATQGLRLVQFRTDFLVARCDGHKLTPPLNGFVEVSLIE